MNESPKIEAELLRIWGFKAKVQEYASSGRGLAEQSLEVRFLEEAVREVDTACRPQVAQVPRPRHWEMITSMIGAPFAL